MIPLTSSKARLIRLTSVACVFCVLFLLGCSAFALDRNAFTFTNYDLHLRVIPAQHGFFGEGKITLRNDSPLPQRNLSLQISSTLEWKSIQFEGKSLTYVTQPYESDIDHTGAVTEAVVDLPQAVAAKQSLVLEVSYAGTIAASGARLTRIGAPEALALRNDWDRISPDFTALRGVGFVCWYPVAMDSASLSSGNQFFDVLGEWKQRHAASSMNVAIEAVGESSIIGNGRLVAARAHAAAGPDQPSTREADYSFAEFGLYPPAFAIADYAPLSRPAISVSYVPDHRAAAEEFALAAEKAVTLVTEWFGPEHEKVQVIELTDPDATPFDSGAMVFTPLRTADKTQLEIQMAHQVAHACTPQLTRPWMAEGLAQFAQALIRERQGGRAAALDWMYRFMPPLQAAENQLLAPDPQASAAGQKTAADQTNQTAPPPAAGMPLTRATDPTYYGIKAMFVWWMLRDMVGDQPLQRAIQGYRPDQDKEPSYFQQVLQAQARRDLEWFFDGWVYRDRGLPDFRIATAFVRAMLGDNISVTLTVENLGDVAAEVPVTVHTDKGDVTQRVLVKGKSKAVQRFQVISQPTVAVVNDGSVPEIDLANNHYKFPSSPAPQ